MRIKQTIPLAVLVAAGLASLGAKRSCSCHFSTAKITKAVLTDKVDEGKVEAIGSKDAFPQTVTKVFYVVTYRNCPKKTKITATWSYKGGPAGSPKPQVIDKPVEKVVRGSGRIAFSLTRPNRGFPPGKYEVVVKLNGREVRSKMFTINSVAGTKTPPSSPSSSTP